MRIASGVMLFRLIMRAKKACKALSNQVRLSLELYPDTGTSGSLRIQGISIYMAGRCVRIVALLVPIDLLKGHPFSMKCAMSPAAAYRPVSAKLHKS